MPELQRATIAINIFKPQVIVDCVEGYWFAIVSDGSSRVEVTEWPLWDCQFSVDAHTILHVELYTADDEAHFRRNECSKFSEVYIPAAKVANGRGGVFRSWFGLQKGYFLEEVNLQIAMERYETSLALAKCLLTPKLCISILAACATSLEGPSAARDGVIAESNGGSESDALLRQSVVQHGTIITALHQQMYALWLNGRIVSGGRSITGGLSAHLIDASLEDSSPLVFGVHLYEKLTDAESTLQDEVSRLTESIITTSARLEQSERLKTSYRERITELTGEQFEEDDCTSLDEADFASIQALQRETRSLQEKLKVERARTGAAQKDLQALRSGSWIDSKAEDLKRKHSDELRQLSRIHAVEVEAFRAAEHEQRLLVQELQRKSDDLTRDVLRKEAQATVLHEEIGELTARLAQPWSTKPQSSRVSTQDRPLADHTFSFAEFEASRREVEELRHQLLSAEEIVGSGSNGRPSAIPSRTYGSLGNAIARSESVLQEFESARRSDRELLLCSEVNRLVIVAKELLNGREDAQIACEDVCRRRDVDEQQDGSDPARVKLAEELKSPTQHEEVLELRAHLDKERQALKEQAESHEQVLRQRDAQYEKQLVAVYAELSIETQARHKIENNIGEAHQAEFSRGEHAASVAASEREERLRSELQDLEDANMAMSQQTQRQFDDFAALQERFSREILTFRKEQATLENGPACITKLQQTNRALHRELQELRGELNEERRRRREVEEVTISRKPSERFVFGVSSSGTHIGSRPMKARSVERVTSGLSTTSPSAVTLRATSSHMPKNSKIAAVIGVLPSACNVERRRD